MSRAIDTYPLGWKIDALAVLAVCIVATWGFIYRYTSTSPWRSTQFGRHLVAMSACLGGFFTFYAVLAVWPHLPGASAIRLVLFHLLAATVVWRWWLFERTRRADRKTR